MLYSICILGCGCVHTSGVRVCSYIWGARVYSYIWGASVFIHLGCECVHTSGVRGCSYIWGARVFIHLGCECVFIHLGCECVFIHLYPPIELIKKKNGLLFPICTNTPLPVVKLTKRLFITGRALRASKGTRI